MSSLDDRPFPKPALIGAGLLILSTITGVGIIQAQKHFAHASNATIIEATAPQQSRTLRFVDQGDGVSVYGGHVRVFDAMTGSELQPLQEREGFVRAVLNSLMYQRTKLGISAAPVFELSRWPDGKITIKDQATGAAINVGDFGPGNKAAFLRFFAHTETAS